MYYALESLCENDNHVDPHRCDGLLYLVNLTKVEQQQQQQHHHSLDDKAKHLLTLYTPAALSLPKHLRILGIHLDKDGYQHQTIRLGYRFAIAEGVLPRSTITASYNALMRLALTEEEVFRKEMLNAKDKQCTVTDVALSLRRESSESIDDCLWRAIASKCLHSVDYDDGTSWLWIVPILVSVLDVSPAALSLFRFTLQGHFKTISVLRYLKHHVVMRYGSRGGVPYPLGVQGRHLRSWCDDVLNQYSVLLLQRWWKKTRRSR
eukprot:PhF_6_TR27822/c0_g1_i1/m.40584